MNSTFLDQIDWRQPWMEVLQPAAISILQAPDWRAALNAAAGNLSLRNQLGLPIHFVAQSELPHGIGYEAFIGATGCVPTRDNLHDFFNALTWLTFPAIKRQLNALQTSKIREPGTISGQQGPAGRGKLRDAATIFDENAALLITFDTKLVADLRNHRWHDAFVSRRANFGSACRVWPFGHALLEKLATPYKAITAHGWVVPGPDEFFSMAWQEQRAWLDATVAGQLAHGLVTGDFMPLPVLGIPGWWQPQDAAFYNDASVFRPVRGLKA